MNNTQANQLSGSLIPDVLGNLINKSNNPDDSVFSLEKLLASITGGKSDMLGASHTGGIGDLLKQFEGGGMSGGGLMDIIKGLAGGAQEQQQRNGGGLLDLIKGFVK
jgi:hypothetical protein